MRWLRHTRATGIGFILLGLVVLALSLGLEGPRHMAYGPGLFPSALGILMALAGLVVALSRYSGAAEASGDPEPAADEPPSDGQPSRDRIAAFAVFAIAPFVFAFVLPILGFLIATPVLIAILAMVSGARWPTAVATGVVSTVLLQTIFQQVMRVPLPWGLLERYAGVLTWM